MKKSIKRNFLYNILLNISKVIFPLITAPYVSRILEPDGVGLFNFANTYANYFAFFAALGIPLYGIREIAKIKDDVAEQTRFVSEIVSISIVSTIICTLVLFFSLLWVPQLTENYVIFLVAATILYTTPFKIDWFFSGKEEFGYITFRSLVIKTLSVILLFVLVREKSDLLTYVALNAGALVLNELWNFVKLYNQGIHPYFTLSGKRHIKPLLILFSSSIAISIYAILDTLMLGFMTNYDEVGYYNCATHIVRAFTPVVTSLATVILPRMTILKEKGEWEEANILINKSFSVVGYLSIPLAIGIASISSIFVPLFFGSQFYGTVLPLQIMTIIIIAIGFNNLTGIQILLGLGLDKLFLYSILAGTITNFILNLCLIPFYGASGAASASVVAEVTVLVVMFFYIYKNTPIRFNQGKEIFLDFLIASGIIAVAYIAHVILSGWMCVFFVIILSAVLYIVVQQLFGNSSQKILWQMFLKKLKK